ncbi:hypothetical protein CV102_20585 [Natronococcus pandeyae]|uniref:Uncharacterized protein n=1 Tax=Natronococcus pandeyae TaxID=2055836 RepID=A0A8J8TNH5_9EURY|nr:hypothetical protein [Natronococcus pandeyae]TYL36681.1 hypothetical protein CV102_20585 [Natronococcus pandeyae]
MDDSDRPAPPNDLDPELRAVLEALGEEDAETLQTVASYVDDLATWAESSADHESASSADDEPSFPADVPDRASVTITEIGGTEYYYYQWRDGDEIRSKTKRR